MAGQQSKGGGGGGPVRVEGYRRSDGTTVKGYNRDDEGGGAAKPAGINARVHAMQRAAHAAASAGASGTGARGSETTMDSPRAHPAAALHGGAGGHASTGGQRTPAQGQASEALRCARAGNVEQGMAAGTSHLHERQAAADVAAANRAASRDHRDSRGLPRPVTYSEQLERDAAASLERWKASGRIPDTESPKDKAEREAYLRSPEAAAERARTAVENERGDSGVPAGSFSVDRFEGDKAVLVNEDGDTKVVLRSKLGPGVRPGHVLRGDLTADEAATKKVEDDTAAVQKRLKRE